MTIAINWLVPNYALTHFFFLASLTDFLSTGLHQYGDLHKGQVFGSIDLPSSSNLGHHLCSQRIQSNCSISTFFPNSESISNYLLYYVAYILCAVNNIYPRVYDCNMEIKVFGEQAKQIHTGQTFTARIDSVEGRTVVILESKEEFTEQDALEESWQQVKEDAEKMENYQA